MVIKIFLFLISFAAFASEEGCNLSDSLTGSEKLSDLSTSSIEAACAEFQRNNKCLGRKTRETNLNPDLLAKSLIERENKRVRDIKVLGSRNSLVKEVFEAAQQENPSLTKEFFESKLKNKISSFVKSNNCEPSFGDTNESLGYADIGGVAVVEKNNSISDFKNILKDEEFIKKAENKRKRHNLEHFDEFLDKESDEETKFNNLSFCTSKKELKTQGPSKSDLPVCRSSVSKYFADNSAVLDERSAEDVSGDQKELLKCIKNNEKAGYEVSKIIVKSSANQLRNTSSTQEIMDGKGFCGFDFMGLSKARSLFAKENLVPLLLGNNGSMKVEIDPSGTNGNGTSGPCPYDENGSVKSSFTGSGKKDLDKYKQTELIVEFKATQKVINSAKGGAVELVKVSSPCKSLRIKCQGDL